MSSPNQQSQSPGNANDDGEASDLSSEKTLPHDTESDTVLVPDTPKKPNRLKEKMEPLSGKRFLRYEVQELLGQGGLSSVHKAFDPMLGRTIALKVIRGPEITTRRKDVLNEARAQAKVDHPHICRVYDVGITRDVAFIAMQLINGPTLRRAAPRMSLDEKLAVMRKVIIAIHEAHRFGLIHRDLKPGNIMVEQDENGEWHPYVMDFGLAQDTQMRGSDTEAGQIIGTPAYMSPEQARGNTRLVDSRTDVYSLGATLYEILCGKPPFRGKNSFSVLMKVLGEEPPPPSGVNPNVPRELELITVKCMQKDPEDRFDSAREIGEELDRYLAGDPVKSHPQSFTYLLGKKLKKHLTLYLTIFCVLLLFLSLGGYTLHNTIETRRQNRHLQLFLGKVQELEWYLRVNLMMPRRNINQAREQMSSQIAEIKTDLDQGDATMLGPGHYAMGRGYADLQEYSLARDHLEKAISYGFQTPSVRLTLGLVLGKLYEKALRDANQIGIAAIREEQIKILKTSLRDPALDALKTVDAQEVYIPNALIHAQIAFYEERYDQALEYTARLYKTHPWLYEARLLEAHVFLSRGTQALRSGQFEEARQLLNEANRGFTQAQKIGPSDAEAYVGQSDCFVGFMEIGVQTGGDVMSPYTKALDSANLALEVIPGNLRALENRQYAHLTLAEYHYYLLGKDPSAPLTKAMEEGETILAENRVNPKLYNFLGMAYSYLAEYKVSRKENPEGALERAHEFYQSALELEPGNTLVLNNQGLTYWQQSEYEASTGKDPRPLLEKAVSCYAKAISLNPRLGDTYNNMGLVHWTLAEHDYRIGHDPLPKLDLAIQQFREAVRIHNGYFAHSNLVESMILKCRILQAQKIDIADTVLEIRGLLTKARKVNPKDFELLILQSKLALLQARRAMKAGASPSAFFEESYTALRGAAQLSEGKDKLLLSQGWHYYWETEWYLLGGDTERVLALIELGRQAIRDFRAEITDNSEIRLLDLAFNLQEIQVDANDRDSTKARQVEELLANTLSADPKLRMHHPELALKSESASTR